MQIVRVDLGFSVFEKNHQSTVDSISRLLMAALDHTVYFIADIYIVRVYVPTCVTFVGPWLLFS
jgi:hypothetical protein